MGATTMHKLSQSEQIVYDALCRAADEMDFCPKNEDLAELAGFNSLGGMADLVSRLEEKGFIEVRRFQRSRQVRIVATDKWTVRPINMAPHWRNRPPETLRPAPDVVTQRKPNMAAEIMSWANKRGVSLSDALADLVFVGWEVEKERG